MPDRHRQREAEAAEGNWLTGGIRFGRRQSRLPLPQKRARFD